jgi:hypothetical protein
MSNQVSCHGIYFETFLVDEELGFRMNDFRMNDFRMSYTHEFQSLDFKKYKIL